MHEIHRILINLYDIPIKQKMQENFTYTFLYPSCFFRWRYSNLTFRFVNILNQMGGFYDNGSTYKLTTTFSYLLTTKYGCLG